MKKIKYVQLEPAAVLTDLDWQKFNATQRGIYLSIILNLYCHGGKIENNPATLKLICNCENFEENWKIVCKKFRLRGDEISHKRVSKELILARRRLQVASESGLKGAKSRWAAHGNPIGRPNGRPMTKKNEEKESEEKESKRKDESPRSGLSSVSSLVSSVPARLKAPGPLASEMLKFHDSLCRIIEPKNQADKTTFHKVGNWLMIKIMRREFNTTIFERVLRYAKESAAGPSGNPAAVFMSRIKTELGYSPSNSRV